MGNVGISDEHTFAWPMWAFVKGNSGGSSSRMWVGGGKKQRNDRAMFGNGWLPNIAIIMNQCFNYEMLFTKLTQWAEQNSKFKWWGLHALVDCQLRYLCSKICTSASSLQFNLKYS